MADVGIGGAANVSSAVAIGIYQKAKRHIRYVRIYKTNVEMFEEKLSKLMAKRAGVQQEIDAAKRNDEKIKADVEDWCDRVDKKIEEEKKNVKDLEDRAKNKCFIGLCPNLKCRYRLSRKAEESANLLDGLLRGEFNRVSYRDIPEDIVGGPPKDSEAFKSREKVFNDIMEELKDSTIRMIGVYGMPGVGKTTLVNKVARQAKKEKLFAAVVMGVVSQTPDIQEIQNEIADSLGLEFKEQGVIGRARRLCERLKKEKKILVVLDDLWARLNLEEVGIPFGDENNGCHILITSRDRNVLTNEMDAQPQQTFQIGVLEEEEAWQLFKKMAGNNFESPELQSIATEVAKRCGGLPLAIVTVARALRNKGLFAWNDALRTLQRPSPANFKGIPQHVYSAIEFSYNHLGSEELKQTFLLFCLLGNHAFIQDLLKYSIGLGLFHGVITVEETRDRLLTVVNDLKASCLLHEGHSAKCAGMHDLTCNVAVAIASKDNNVLALKNEDVLPDWPDLERMKMLKKINLDNASISLPEGLQCPQLTFFHMHSKDLNVEMPSKFFMEMKNLKVLDLTKMHFSSLPSSISVLTNLRTLCLDQCVLEDIALIGKLKNLEILSLMKSEIGMLPMEIGQLIRLRLFDLGGCRKLKKILPGVLSSLSRLEELYMDDSFVEWEGERHANQQTNATLAELKHLPRLTSLEIHIPDAKIMPQGLFLEKLKRYEIFIGKARGGSGKHKYKFSRTLSLELNGSIDQLNDGIKTLLRKSEDLYLENMKGAKIALHGLIHDEGFQHLKNLHIQNCLDIQYIIDDDDGSNNEFLQLQSLTLESLPQLISFSCEYKSNSTSGSQHDLPLFGDKMVFPSLKNLCLSSIKNAERIWRHPLSNKSFRTQENLTSLIIEGCGNLKQLLSSSVARSLVNLECLEIGECKWLKEIMFSEENDTIKEVVLFSQLNSLKIKNLQHLMGFCSEDYKIEFPSLKLLEIGHCPALKAFVYHKSTAEENQNFSSQAFFDEKVAFPSLEKLWIVYLRNLKMIWHNQLSTNSFSKLKEIVLQHCNELVTLFPCDMWSTFQSLETLKVCNCGSLEEIFELQSLNMEETHAVATQFRELHIHDLPKLKHVWSKDPQGMLTFQNLTVVQVWDCWSLQNVFPASIARGLSQLKDLNIQHCGVEEIVAKEEGSHTWLSFEFDQLSSLMLWNLPELLCFYPGMHTTKWPVLKRLKSWHCEKMKIFGTNMNDYEDDSQQDSPKQRHHHSLFLVEKIITKLEEVCLNSVDIAMISDTDKFSSSQFCEVTTLHVHCYHDKSAAFPITFLEKFNHLEKLEIGCCEFEELLFEGGFGKQIINAGTFLPFKSLKLNGLHNVKYIWKQESGLDHFLANLEALEVIVCHNLISLGSSSASFQNLMTLDISKCKAMINLVTSSSAIQSLVQLKILRISHCASMKEVVGSTEGSQATDDIIFKFNRLKCIELRNLPSLESFCSGNHSFVFPSLEQVIVIKCPELEIFCKGIVNSPMLKGVQATEKDKKGEWADDLNSTVKQLYTKKVGYQGVEYLPLSDFSKSIDIWKENLQETLDFTNLQVLEVKDCSNLTYIFTISMALSLVQLNEIKVNNCPVMEQIIRNEGAEEATTSRIMLPRLVYITLESCSSLTSFMLGSNTLECPSLRKVTVVDCPKMFEFTSAFSRKHDTANAPFFNDKVLCPDLWFLELSSLNIQKIWPDQSQVTSYNVQNLEIFLVKRCHSLKNILPSSLCKELLQLDQLGIYNCTNVEEVIYTERLTETQTQLIEAESTTKFVFPKLRLLDLRGLPSLKSFCSKIHAIELPLLQELWVIRCSKVEMLAREFQKRQGESQPQIFQQPLLWVNEDSFPNLEGLLLQENGTMEEIWHKQVPAKYFPKLNWLKLIGFPKNAVAFPKCFIQSLPNLEKLRVSKSFFIGIFQSEGLSRLRKLRLSQLPELAHLWKEGIPSAEVFYNLTSLKVFGCDKLENVLVPSSVPFKTLTTLAVSNCHGLKNLVTLPTARNMMLLERLRVTHCRKMKEIIASTSDDEEMDGIIFSQLKSLELGHLSGLSRFCSGNYTFGFPSLEKLIMEQCPKMESFSEGDLSTPMLQGVQSTEGEYVGCWEGDLNAIIQQLFVEKIFPSMEDLEQSSINIQRIWLWKLLAASSYAQNLTCLAIVGCPNLECLFSFSMVRSFLQLKMLHIDNCENVETIIFTEGSREGELMSQTSFRVLESLLLIYLPKLTRFCHGCCIEFPLLKFFRIENCPIYIEDIHL